MSERGRSCQIDPVGCAGPGDGWMVTGTLVVGLGAAVVVGVVLDVLDVLDVVVIAVLDVLDVLVVVEVVDVVGVVVVLVDIVVVVGGVVLVEVAVVVAPTSVSVSATDSGAESAAVEHAPSSTNAAQHRRLPTTGRVCHRPPALRPRERPAIRPNRRSSRRIAGSGGVPP